MKLSVLEVTPEMATRWLANNGMNRRVSSHHVMKLARQMQGGNWVLNGQTISFDEQGRLLDGQHRLNAVVESGVTVKMTVALGVSDPDAFKTYDTVQLKRGAHQIAEMMGVKDPIKITSAARVLSAWERTRTTEEFAQLIKHPQKTDPGPAAMAEYSASVVDEIENAASMIGDKIQKMSGAKAVLIGMIALLNRIDPVSTASFCEKLSSGIFTKENDPVMLLRERILTRDKKISGRSWNFTLVAWMIKAFNYHCEGKELKTLRLRSEGDQPEAFPSIIGGGRK